MSILTSNYCILYNTKKNPLDFSRKKKSTLYLLPTIAFSVQRQNQYINYNNFVHIMCILLLYIVYLFYTYCYYLPPKIHQFEDFILNIFLSTCFFFLTTLSYKTSGGGGGDEIWWKFFFSVYSVYLDIIIFIFFFHYQYLDYGVLLCNLFPTYSVCT